MEAFLKQGRRRMSLVNLCRECAGVLLTLGNINVSKWPSVGVVLIMVPINRGIDLEKETARWD